MQTSNRLFEDLARVASGALSTLSGLREEVETRIRERIERLVVEMDLVPREEFDAVREMLARAREEQERLAERVSALEERIKALEARRRSSTSARKTTRAGSRRRGGEEGSGPASSGASSG